MKTKWTRHVETIDTSSKIRIPKRSTAGKAKHTVKSIKKQAKKAAAPKAKRAPKAIDPEKQRAKEERERQRAERQRIKDEKLRIKMQKEAAKLEKLKMWELKPDTSVQVPKTHSLHRIPWDSKAVCCTFCNNRKALSCVYKNDLAGLKACLEDTEHISNPFQPYSIDCQLNIIKQILAQDNTAMFQLCIDYLAREKKDEIKRVKLADVGLQKQGTGHSNKYSFNFPMRQVKLSRGGKEGNNAFTHDSKIRKLKYVEADDILKLSPPIAYVKIMLETKRGSSKEKGPAFKKDKKGFLKQKDLVAFWAKAARRGDFALLRHIITAEKGDSQVYGFGRLHQSAILQGPEAEAVKVLKRQTLIKATPDDHAIVPMHLACINPDPTILKNFFRMYPTSFQTDSKGRDLIHYAVANKNPDILEFFIQKRQIINNADNEGLTPMMIACKLGRVKSVQLLLEDQEKQQATLDPKDKDYQHYASFYSYMDTPGPFQNTPLHYAARQSSLQIVKALVEAGANLELKNFYNETPFAVACAQGNLDIAEYLVEKGANIHGADKQQKSPLIKACINGQDHIVALLLRRGVNANFCDLSENTALHYACAYGWLDIAKLLVEKGNADVNRLNEWKSSPTIIAMLKGHFGIVDYLLSCKGINASLVDDQGRSLVSQLCMTINEDSAKNLKFLLQKQKIDVTKVDTQGFSALHHLCNLDVTAHVKELIQNKEEPERNQYYMRRGKKVKVRSYSSNRRYGNYADYFMNYCQDESERKEFFPLLKKLIQVQIQCAQLLIKAGLRPDSVTNKENGHCSPVFLAVMGNNFELAQEIFEEAIKLKPQSEEVYDFHPAIMGRVTDKKENLLHLFAFQFMQYPHGFKFLERVAKEKSLIADLKKMSLEQEHLGFTPFLCYFRELKENMHNYQFTQCLSQSTEDETYIHATKTFVPDAIKSIKNVCAFYANTLNYDTSSRVGLSANLKEEAKTLLDNKGLSQAQYNKLINLEFPESGKDVLDPLESEGRFDDILSFDPLKQQLGLLDTMTETQDQNNDEDEDEDNSDGDDSNSKSSEKTDTFDPLEYIKDEDDCLSNGAHLLLKGLKNVYERIWDKQRAKVVVDYFNEMFNDLLVSSKPFLEVKKNSKLPVGFNRTDKEGNTCLFAALKETNTSAALLMINSQMLDVTAKKEKSNLTALHLIASLVSDEQTLKEIFKKIDKTKLLTEDRNGNTPLHYAAYARNIAMVHLLVDSVPNQKQWINKSNAFGVTALHLSLLGFDEKKDHTPALERFLIQHGANAKLQDEYNRSPLCYLFFKKRPQAHGQQRDPANALMTLLKEANLKTADLTVQDKNKYTLLHHACIAGATICALTLINNGCDTSTTNILNNTPFAESLAYEQQQICMFMIQNNCSINEQVHFLEEKGLTSRIDEMKKMILPADLYKEWFIKSKDEKQLDAKDQLSKDYKIKSFTPFQKAMECGWGGIGYLLLSKNFKAFEALSGCLKAHKYESFLDMLNSCDKATISSVDSKGRTLIHLLLRHLGERDLEKDSPELKRAFEVMDFLVSKHGLNSNARDLRGYNLLHTIALKGNITAFCGLILRMPKAQVQAWLNESCTAKHQAAPLTLLCMRHDFSNLEDFNELMTQLKKLLTDAQLKNLPITFMQEVDPETQKIPEFLDFSKPFKCPRETQSYQSNLLLTIFNKHIEMGQQLVKNDAESYKFMCHLAPFFDSSKAGACSLLQHCVKMCESGTFLQFLLGIFKDEDNKYLDNRKPRVNVDQQDSQGMTALHYALVPALGQAKGRRQNTQAIELLLKKGANYSIKDKLGRTAVDLARGNKSLRELFAPYVKEFVKDQHLSSEFEVDCQKPGEVYVDVLKAANRSYTRDADEFLQTQLTRLRKNQMEVDKQTNRPEVAVDEHDDLVNCEVVKSDIVATTFASADKPQPEHLFYDVALIKIDVKASYYGINVFYIMQLLFDKAKQIYILWTRWGRIGDFGQYQRTPFPTLVAAQIEFSKLFRQKTGNKWEEVNNYTKLPKRYSLRRISGKTVFKTKNMKQWVSADNDVDLTEVFIDFEKHQDLKKSVLSKQELSFIKPLVNSASILRKVGDIGENNLFWECMLDRTVLNQMLDVLQQLIKLARKTEKLEEDKAEFQSYAESKEQMFELMNQYYELSTPSGFAFDKLKILDNGHEIGREISSLLQLREVENASQLLLAAGKNLDKQNPYDFCFKNLNCEVKPVDNGSEDYELVMRYVNSSFSKNDSNTNRRQVRRHRGYTKQQFRRMVKSKSFRRPAVQRKDESFKGWIVSNIFEVAGQSSNTVDQKKREHTFKGIHNHMMLFHGTNSANLISILEQGMHIQPSNAARHNGSAFGRGIYFADKFSLAVNYSHSDKEDDSLYVLVCEVALGNVMNSIGNSGYNLNEQGYFCTGDDFAKGFHSVRVMGSSGPNFDENWIQDFKAENAQVAPIWPVGRVISYANPYFIYKNSQYTKLEDLVAENQPKAKKAPKKKASRKKRDSDDEEDEDDENGGNDDEELAKQLTKVHDLKLSVNHIVANEIHHIANPEDFNYSGFSYNIDDSQYIVANSDQVRVKYIIQIERSSK